MINVTIKVQAPNVSAARELAEARALEIFEDDEFQIVSLNAIDSNDGPLLEWTVQVAQIPSPTVTDPNQVNLPALSNFPLSSTSGRELIDFASLAKDFQQRSGPFANYDNEEDIV